MSHSVAPPNLGPILNTRRKARGLTLDALATASGVSRSMLSQIERGQASPTFSTLWNIARALDLRLDELVSGEPEETRGIDLVLDHYTPEIRSEDGLCVLRILNPAEAAGRTEWYMLTIEPGGALVSGAHAKGTSEHLTVLEGRLSVIVGGGSAVAEAGETARYDVGAAHEIRNEGDVPAKALLVVMSENFPI